MGQGIQFMLVKLILMLFFKAVYRFESVKKKINVEMILGKSMFYIKHLHFLITLRITGSKFIWIGIVHSVMFICFL